jgi:RNA polymerase sigma-70 factor, ECF subfamily
MNADITFDDLMRQVRAGEDAAETAVFQQYVGRLRALATRRFAASLRDRADIDLVVLSACKSFFLRHRRGELPVDDPDGLWSALAMIALRKCSKRLRYLRADRRDVGRDVEAPDGDDGSPCWTDRSPSPEEVAVSAEAVEFLKKALSADDWAIIERLLAEHTASEIAAELRCSVRTVGRVKQRARHLLRRLIDAEGAGVKRR